ncbi:hypothetical protein KAI65_06010 [Candidatus Parcubacteria bacterium]|nr:hypothetical protein [Candidatus Parcubacteria bacterium]
MVFDINNKYKRRKNKMKEILILFFVTLGLWFLVYFIPSCIADAYWKRVEKIKEKEEVQSNE